MSTFDRLIHIGGLAVMAAVCLTIGSARAGNGTNSPYSRFGLGSPADGAQGFNKGMGGVAMGFRQSNRLNVQNPASYSALDSLSFIFDVGLSLQNTNFKQAGSRMNAHNTSMDYINAGFRLAPGLGLALGFVPVTTIGYDFSESKYLGKHQQSGAQMTYTNAYTGDGGVHNVFLGLGWEIPGGLSIGVNAGYLWGDYQQYITQTFYEDGTATSSADGLRRQITSNVSTYKLDIGVQYQTAVGKNDNLTVGAVYSLGHTIQSKAHYYNFLYSGDTTHVAIKGAFRLPHTVSAGLTWEHKGKLRVGTDVTFQNWSKCRMAQIIDDQFVSSSEGYMDRTKVCIGAEYIPDRMGSKYLKRVLYRLGASYATPYFKVNSFDGPSEYILSAGVGMPVSNSVSNRSYVNIALRWVHTAAGESSLIKENSLQLCVGLTFNERWFMKWKIQ